jgi:predicted dehydrogenase
MRALRLGLLGTGIAARKLYAPALRPLASRVRLHACANRTRSKAEAFAREAGVPIVAADAKALFAVPGLDAVFISLPIEAQPRYVLEALRRGIPVLSEKPVAPSLAAGRTLLKRARPLLKAGTPWMVAENFSFLPAVAWAEDLLKRGALGDVRLVEIRQSGVTDASVPYFHTPWRTRPRFVGGFVLDAGVHLAHIVRRYFGMPLEIRGLHAQFSPSLPPMDTALAVLRFPSGCVGTWMSSFSAAAGGPMIAIRGSKGALELDPDHAVFRPLQGKALSFRSSANSHGLQLAHFAEVVLKGKAPAVGPREALLDLAFMEGVVRGRALWP